MKIKRFLLLSSVLLSAFTLSACSNSEEVVIEKGNPVDSITFNWSGEVITINSNDSPESVAQLLCDNRIFYKLDKSKGWVGTKNEYIETIKTNVYNSELEKLEDKTSIYEHKSKLEDYTHIIPHDDYVTEAYFHERYDNNNGEKVTKKMESYIELTQITSDSEYFIPKHENSYPIQETMDIYYNSSNILNHEGISDNGKIRMNHLDNELTVGFNLYNAYLTLANYYDLVYEGYISNGFVPIIENERLSKYVEYDFELTDKYLVLEYHINFPEKKFGFLDEDPNLLEEYDDEDLDELSNDGFYKYIYYADYHNIEEDTYYLDLDYVEYESVSTVHTEYIYGVSQNVPEKFYGEKYTQTQNITKKSVSYVTNKTEEDYNNFVNKMKENK